MDRAEILRRFEAYLDAAMSDEEPPVGIPAEILEGDGEAENSPTDWYTIWAAVTALTQEVKLQGRAFKQMGETLAADAERRCRKESLGGLLEMRERLQRGLASVAERPEIRPALWDRIFRERWRQVVHALDVVNALEEGYRLSLGYLDDLLFQFQVQPIDCQGRKFDPRRMNAVDVEETDQAEEGTVVSVYRMGYEWNGELFRPAQVRVARRPRSAASNE
ncbi:MAG TPA: nucleotide exchange factor GrpE [Bryobacteraceae bacterium]|nr:nucleotide exchange factor GrpE [Bryobacteraceae bacterium]